MTCFNVTCRLLRAFYQKVMVKIINLWFIFDNYS